MEGASWLSKIDLSFGYHQVRVREDDVEKTALLNYEFVVIPFGLTNVPAVFMDLINLVSRTMLDRSVIVFINDILVHSKTREQHKEHLCELLGVLR